MSPEPPQDQWHADEAKQERERNQATVREVNVAGETRIYWSPGRVSHRPPRRTVGTFTLSYLQSGVCKEEVARPAKPTGMQTAHLRGFKHPPSLLGTTTLHVLFESSSILL
jgi:hypothetical protein